MSSGMILVTGGAGYVGAHTCKALQRAGYTPVVFDNLSTGYARFVRWGPLVSGDIRNTDAVLRTMRSHDIDAVLHLAAASSVHESIADPQKYYENNVVGSLSLLNAMLQTGCRKLVFSSTCAIYGAPSELPIRETAPQRPINPYGASKMMVERVLSDVAHAHALEALSLRYFNAAGADPEGELGEVHEVETRVIPTAMLAIQGYLADFTLFGTDYDTPDGSAIRDYVHVSDLAEAHVLALKRLLAGGAGGAFNLGTGHGYSVKQVLDAIAAETGETLTPVAAPRRKGDPPILVADATLARTDLGFAPILSDLESIVRTAWAWHQQTYPKKAESTAP